MKTQALFMLLAASLSLDVAAAGAPASAATVVRLPNCQYAGQSLSADLSTTTVVNSTDPHWSVSGPTGNNLAPGHTALPSWTALPNNWVQPSAPSATAVNEPAGKYTYMIRFYVPCEPKNYASIHFQGGIAADNEILSASLNGTVIPGVSCSGNGGYCFKTTYGPVPLPSTSPPPGLVRGYNTLTVTVNNDGGPSGMATVLHIVAVCGKECCMLLERVRRDEAAPANEQ